MKITLSVLIAVIGSIGGHIRPRARIKQTVEVSSVRQGNSQRRVVPKHCETFFDKPCWNHPSSPHAKASVAQLRMKSRDRSIADQMRDLRARCERHLEMAEHGKKILEMTATS